MRLRGHRPRPWLLGVLPLVLAATAAEGSPARLLREASEAGRLVSYMGIRIVRTSGREEEREQKVRVWHLAPDRTRMEYLSPNSGNVLLVSGSGRWYYSQRRGQWRSIEWHAPRSHLDLLLQNYRVRREGGGTVAGRRVIQLSLSPRHPGNPSKRLWIDPSTHLILREEVRSHEGRLIASSTFEQFELVREFPPDLFEPPSTPPARANAPRPPFPPLRPRYMPPGYQEVRQSGLRRGSSDGVHVRYTDGLGTISVFQFRGEPGDRRERAERAGRRGEGHREGAPDRVRLSRQIGDLHCTVMGDVAADELRKLLDSLSP